MRTPLSWYALLVGICLVGPYLLCVRPRSWRDWFVMTLALAFLTWLLADFASVRSR